MTKTLTCEIEPATAISQWSLQVDCQLITELLADSMTVISLPLLGNRLTSQTREKEETILMLCNEDRDHFLETLKNPPQPNQKLKEGFDYYYERKSQDARNNSDN